MPSDRFGTHADHTVHPFAQVQCLHGIGHGLRPAQRQQLG